MRPKMFVLAFAIAALTVALVATVALGDDRSTARATLIGYEETPSVSSLGHGDFRATINDGAQRIDYSLTLGGTFNSPIAVAHIHFGQRGVAGGVSAFLCGGGSKSDKPCPQSGTVTGMIVPSDVIGPAGQGIAAGEWRELVAAMRAGVTYANAHSATQSGGEIRGQITTRGNRDNNNNDD
jgi:CHRD domain-containing protein